MNSRKMKFPGRRWRRIVVLAAALGFMSAGQSLAAEPSWPTGPYNYLVVDQDIRAVLEQFGRNVNIPIRVSRSVEAKRLKGKLSAGSAKAFLQWLCDSYDLDWYFDGAVLHVFARSELRNIYFDLGEVPFEELNQRLVKAGIADERFAIRPTAEPHLISIMGPPVYTALVGQMIKALQETAKAAAPQPEPAAVPQQRKESPIVPAAPAPEQKPEPPKRIRQASPAGQGDVASGTARYASPANVPTSSTSSPAGKPTAWQNMGIEVKLMDGEEKKRLRRMMQGPNGNARSNEDAGVMVFRGSRR
jgi:hypothetical protein